VNVEFHMRSSLEEESAVVGWDSDGRHGGGICIRKLDVDIRLRHDGRMSGCV